MATLRDYFLARKAENEEYLKFTFKPGFRLMQVVVGGADIDTTDQYRQQLRQAIEDYQKAADMC
jgi:hypothetical protein